MTEAITNGRDNFIFLFVASGYGDVSAFTCHRGTAGAVFDPRRHPKSATRSERRHIVIAILGGASNFNTRIVVKRGQYIRNRVKIVNHCHVLKSEIIRQ